MIPDSTVIIEVVLIIAKVVAMTLLLFLLPLPLTWIERKVAGHIQSRLGPYRVGPHGLFQPLADLIKLHFKEDIVPDKADKLIFKLGPLFSLIPAFAVFVAIPFGDKITLPLINKEVTLYIADMNVGLLYVLSIASLGIYGMILGGWSANSKYALLGGMRSAAQMLSYEIALSFAVVGVVMMSNSLSLVEIVASQGGGFWNWNIAYLPVGPVWFAIFFIAGMAEVNRIPFDLPEDEGTLAAGYHTEYSGLRFAFFMLSEYVAMFTVSILCVILFLGGWNAPLELPVRIPPIIWFLGKVALFIYFFMWIRFTLPRYRYDQLMQIGWKVLIPLSMANILVTGFLRISWLN
ncbi:NADH-ubiquinone oxidoreductase chain H (EC [Olavius sp. associated proteobacterium Delta 1]|nr:NADH-ubiquinone oxidoreductase chain H (EC [Olavius sp. associated proteobacterium Delta 1]